MHWERGNGPQWWWLQSHSGPRHTTASFPAVMRSVLASRKSLCEPHCSSSQKGLCEPGPVTNLRPAFPCSICRPPALPHMTSWHMRLTINSRIGVGPWVSADLQRLNFITGGKTEVQLLVFASEESSLTALYPDQKDPSVWCCVHNKRPSRPYHPEP